jgi:putative addiction module component (TIGR02574 family)
MQANRRNTMQVATDKMLKEALALPARERAALADSLLSSLDEPSVDVDRCWAEEAEARVAAIKRGQAETVSEEDVFAKYDP